MSCACTRVHYNRCSVRCSDGRAVPSCPPPALSVNSESRIPGSGTCECPPLFVTLHHTLLRHEHLVFLVLLGCSLATPLVLLHHTFDFPPPQPLLPLPQCRDAASPGALAATADATLFGRLWAQARERQAACTLDFSKCKLQILEVQPLHFRRPLRRPRSHKRRTPSKRPSTPQPTSYSSQSTVHPHALETFSYKLVATAAVSGNENHAVFGTFYGLPQPKRHWSELSLHG